MVIDFNRLSQARPYYLSNLKRLNFFSRYRDAVYQPEQRLKLNRDNVESILREAGLTDYCLRNQQVCPGLKVKSTYM